MGTVLGSGQAVLQNALHYIHKVWRANHKLVKFHQKCGTIKQPHDKFTAALHALNSPFMNTRNLPKFTVGRNAPTEQYLSGNSPTAPKQINLLQYQSRSTPYSPKDQVNLLQPQKSGQPLTASKNQVNLLQPQQSGQPLAGQFPFLHGPFA